uniref:BHLH domain-containing protein n=1 Tax=Meloidogyne incognita TaxID=6306 RepID=A0A914LY69_MELIC
MEITSKTPNNSSSFLSNLTKSVEQTNNPNNQIDISKIFTNSSIISMIPSSSSELNILELNKESPLNNNKKLQQNKLSEPINGKRNFAQLAKEKIEPYVRKRHNSGSSSERSRKRLNNLNEEEQNILRTNINSRERKRMHDINIELDELRRVLPYTDIFQQQKEQNDEKQSKQFKQNNARKLSKINTIILATNW